VTQKRIAHAAGIVGALLFASWWGILGACARSITHAQGIPVNFSCESLVWAQYRAIFYVAVGLLGLFAAVRGHRAWYALVLATLVWMWLTVSHLPSFLK
jgi:hypothetical protein